jgi:iron uptake system component EfeO
MIIVNRFALFVVPLSVALFGCSSSDETKTDADYKQEVTTGMHDTLLADIKLLHSASQELQAAAPLADDRGWDADADEHALVAMQAAWLKARGAYERTEGALAPLFPDIDGAIDARYDDFLVDLGRQGDTNLFDDEGVTGMHAIERILFAPEIPQSVVEAEATLPGYKAAAWPATHEEAQAFKEALCARLVEDTGKLVEQWTPQKIDLDGAFQGLVSLMNEQREKVVKAASFEEESRYSQRTMADIRDNLAGTRNAYAVFQAWVATKPNGSDMNGTVEDAFAELEAAYAAVDGDAIPQPPESWSSEEPSEEDLKSPFGKLYTAVFKAVDPNETGSAVDGMNQAARALGFHEFTAE